MDSRRSGREVIAEMNRLGMMVDLSHPSKGANMEAIRLSKAPVIASHSGVRALANVSRNMDDEQLLALKKNGGVIQIVGFASYVKTDSKERIDALAKLRQGLRTCRAGWWTRCRRGGGGGAGAGRGRGAAAGVPIRRGPVPLKLLALPRKVAAADVGEGILVSTRSHPNVAPTTTSRLAAIDAKFPPAARANVKDFVNHIDYAVKLIGLDHVGISSDFDGGGGIDGWNSAAEAFNVTLELTRRGYTEQQIGKMWSGNLLRVWGEVEKVSQKLRRSRIAAAHRIHSRPDATIAARSLILSGSIQAAAVAPSHGRRW
jgi:membrane dipeptidase